MNCLVYMYDFQFNPFLGLIEIQGKGCLGIQSPDFFIFWASVQIFFNQEEYWRDELNEPW